MQQRSFSSIASGGICTVILADADLAIEESKVAWGRWPSRGPREVLTAYGQSITLEALLRVRVRGEVLIIGRASTGATGPV